MERVYSRDGGQKALVGTTACGMENTSHFVRRILFEVKPRTNGISIFRGQGVIYPELAEGYLHHRSAILTASLRGGNITGVRIPFRTRECDILYLQ